MIRGEKEVKDAFAFLDSSENPTISFPPLTPSGFPGRLDIDQFFPESVCLAWVTKALLAVYLLPPQEEGADTTAAFFVICGVEGKAAYRSGDHYGEFLCELRSAVSECAPRFCDDDNLGILMTGIATGIGVLLRRGGRSKALGGYTWLFHELSGPDTFMCMDLAEAVAVAYQVCAGETTEGFEHWEIDEHGCPLSDDRAFLPSDPALDHALSDYRLRADAERKAKKPKRSTRVRELLWNSYPHICGICGNQIDLFDEMHVDHIIPLSRGGKDILANLQLTHAKCNLKKGSDTPEGDDEGEDANDDT